MLITAALLWILFFLGEYATITKARSLRLEGGNRRDGGFWKPVNGTREDWIRCRGMPCKEWHRSQKKLEELIQGEGAEGVGVAPFDILLTEQQIEELGRLTKEPPGKNRKWKRSTASQSASRLWKLPIRYMFDGYHDETQRQMIRDAIQHWMDNTCVRFTEIHLDDVIRDQDDDVKDKHYILFTREPHGCFSYTGVVDAIPQPVNLEDQCLETFGKPVHEIGHVLGMWHEQQRLDRDEAVIVLENNIGVFKSQFSKHWKVSEDVPYELGSVMHYSSRDGSKNGRMALKSRNPLFQGNMGQRTGLSFGDAKYINLMYCKGSCVSRLERHCENAGYQDPNACHRCKCPDGFSGDYCDDIVKPVNAVCGGVVEVDDGKVVTIETPGYKTPGFEIYKPHTSCTWLFKGRRSHKIQLQFLEEFGVLSFDESCYHWVEVRYQKVLSNEGPRFCGYLRPNVSITSESESLMVIFRSNWTTSDDVRLRGFRALVTAVPTVTDELMPDSSTVVNSKEHNQLTGDSTASPAFTSTSLKESTFFTNNRSVRPVHRSTTTASDP